MPTLNEVLQWIRDNHGDAKVATGGGFVVNGARPWQHRELQATIDGERKRVDLPAFVRMDVPLARRTLEVVCGDLGIEMDTVIKACAAIAQAQAAPAAEDAADETTVEASKG